MWITARNKLFIIKYPFDLTYNIHVGLYLNIKFFLLNVTRLDLLQYVYEL